MPANRQAAVGRAKQFPWNYADFGNSAVAVPAPEQVFEMLLRNKTPRRSGFNRWTINGVAFSENTCVRVPLTQGKRYRLRMRNASDDIHPIHIHRHSFELTRVAGQATSGVMKDVAMVGGYQGVEIDFVADHPGLTLFHCHQQLHMDFGFMALFEYA